MLAQRLLVVRQKRDVEVHLVDQCRGSDNAVRVAGTTQCVQERLGEGAMSPAWELMSSPLFVGGG